MPQTVIGTVPCLPRGVRGDFFGWPVVAFTRISLFNDVGDEVEAQLVRYERGHGAVAVIWVGTDLLAVDPSPDSDDPDWVDASLVVDDELTLRTQPEVPCQWRHRKADV